MEGDVTWDGEHITQYTDDVLQNYPSEIYIILLTKAIPINSIKKKKMEHKKLKLKNLYTFIKFHSINK